MIIALNHNYEFSQHWNLDAVYQEPLEIFLDDNLK